MYNVQFTGLCQGHVWTMLGPCLPIFSFSWNSENFGDSVNLIKRIYISSLQIWDHTKLYLDNVMAIFDIWPSFTSRLARALKFSRLSQPFWKGHVDELSIFGTMSGPCSDYIGSIFSVALFLS